MRKIKQINVYDMDGVLVDTSHRYRMINGVTDMNYWRANHTAEKMSQDIILPLAKKYLEDCFSESVYCVLCSVRSAHILDFEFIVGRLGAPNKILLVGQHAPPYELDYELKRRALQKLFNLRQFQGLPKFLWEDNTRTIQKLRKMFTACVYVPSKIAGVSSL